MHPNSLAVPKRTRREPIPLPVQDSEITTAGLLDLIAHDGESASTSAPVLNAARARINRLLSADPEMVRQELAEHYALLTALMSRYIADSVTAPNSEVARGYGKLALNAQQAALRTLSALQTMKGASAVDIDSDDGGED